ncbi:hypothetical protein TMatcc_005719 [Talaromyces marneffei ATCC 18224]|nr:uncharacterized protein EYB26_005764 [Talaromyces marneffei]KAE8554746.1 hypothetical protein EYB25_003287 [Talaromyces marneffei]QGA18086.1 hypothetical protein EYB26_005764 [Talaromyces marneffei]
MVVSLRLPLSSPRTITSSMISPPLSPDFNFDSDTLTPSTLPALEYISEKLSQKSLHVTLLVGRGQPMPTGESSDLNIIPVTQLDPQSWKIFYKIVEKGAKKYSLGQGWTDALDQHARQQVKNEYLIEQSLRQNEILFSQEGLTLLNVDRIYILKRRLCVLAQNDKSIKNEEKYLSSCVQLLNKTITSCQGRPFSFGFFHRAYEHLNVTDDLLKKVAVAYKARYGQEGIVIITPKSSPALPAVAPPAATTTIKKETTRKSPVMRTAAANTRVRRPTVMAAASSSPVSRHYRVPSRVPSRAGTPRRGPKTPVSASDVTPITRNEWNILIGPEFWQNKPTVTMWVPTPAVSVIC